MRYLTFLLAMLVSSVAMGQITVPAENDQYTPIPVTIKTEVPEGARVSGPGWVFPPAVKVYTISPTQLVVCAPPGEYTIQYTLKWLHIVPVTFVDGSGKEVTIQSYLGDGTYDVKATFKVLGGGPNPPPPPPPGQRRAVILEESGKRTAQQTAVISDLRKRSEKPLFQLLDVNQQEASKYSQAFQATTLPCLIVLTEPANQVVRVVPLPTTAEAAVAEVNK